MQRFDIQAPHFVFYVRDQVEELLVRRFGITPEEAQRRIYQDGLTIYTTLDMNMQRTAERLTDPKNEFMTSLREEHNANNAALVAVRPQTGEILAMVGSVDYFDNCIDGQVNMTTSPAPARIIVQAIRLCHGLRERLDAGDNGYGRAHIF